MKLNTYLTRSIITLLGLLVASLEATEIVTMDPIYIRNKNYQSNISTNLQAKFAQPDILQENGVTPEQVRI